MADHPTKHEQDWSEFAPAGQLSNVPLPSDGAAPQGTLDSQFYDEDSDYDNEAWVRKKFYSHTFTEQDRILEKQRKEAKKKKEEDLRVIATHLKEEYRLQKLQKDDGGEGGPTRPPAGSLGVEDLYEKHQAEGVVPEDTSMGESNLPGTSAYSQEAAQAAKRKRKEEEKQKDLQFQKLMRRRKTDAILNCPGCFSPLCFDCQQHAYYPNQFRAMFVTENCLTNKNDVVTIPPIGENPDNQEEYFYKVECAVCGTEVGVMEKTEEIYHFNNVMPGQ